MASCPTNPREQRKWCKIVMQQTEPRVHEALFGSAVYLRYYSDFRLGRL
jgi:hypothetical protein